MVLLLQTLNSALKENLWLKKSFERRKYLLLFLDILVYFLKCTAAPALMRTIYHFSQTL